MPTRENRRYYWLKLPEDFFRQKEIKQLRKIAGGDTYTVIYLKMLLRSLKDDGRLYYDGIEEDFVSELALDIDEDEENVKVTVSFLTAKGLLSQSQPDEYALTAAKSMTGSEGYSAERMRRLRSKRLLASPGDGVVTASDEEKEIEIDKELDIEIEKKKRSRFAPPSQEEVEKYMREYAFEKGYAINPTRTAEDFFEYYSANGWKVGRQSMKDWKMAANRWVRSNLNRGYGQRTESSTPSYVGSPNYDPSKPLY